MKLEKFSSSLDNNQIRYAVSFGSQKINIHEEIKPIKPNALNPSSGSMDICFISKIRLMTGSSLVKKELILKLDLKENWCFRSHFIYIYQRSRF